MEGSSSARRCRESRERSRRRLHVSFMGRLRRQTVEYAGLLAGALVVALVASFTPLGSQIDKDAYDWIFRLYRPPDWEPKSIVLGIDEESFRELEGSGRIRSAVAEGLERLSAVSPKAV